jgi:hypothetical protein
MVFDLGQLVGAVVTGVVGSLILYVLKGQNKQLAEIKLELSYVNGRVRAVEEYKVQGTERHRVAETNIASLQHDARVTRESVHALRNEMTPKLTDLALQLALAKAAKRE